MWGAVGVKPTLRKKREGWGRLRLCEDREKLGYPPIYSIVSEKKIRERAASGDNSF